MEIQKCGRGRGVYPPYIAFAGKNFPADAEMGQDTVPEAVSSAAPAVFIQIDDPFLPLRTYEFIA